MPRVQVPERLREYSAGQEWLRLPGDSIPELLSALALRYPDLAERVLDPEVRLRPHIVILLRDDVVPRDDFSRLAISERDELRIFLAASGG